MTSTLCWDRRRADTKEKRQNKQRLSEKESMPQDMCTSFTLMSSDRGGNFHRATFNKLWRMFWVAFWDLTLPKRCVRTINLCAVSKLCFLNQDCRKTQKKSNVKSDFYMIRGLGFYTRNSILMKLLILVYELLRGGLGSQVTQSSQLRIPDTGQRVPRDAVHGPALLEAVAVDLS